jgi:hypothetical protein
MQECAEKCLGLPMELLFISSTAFQNHVQHYSHGLSKRKDVDTVLTA